MRILLTGGLGFIGHYIAMILRDNHDVLLYDVRSDYGYLDPVKLRNLFEIRRQYASGCYWCWADIRDVDSLNDQFARFKPDIVVHLAALPRARVVYNNPQEGTSVLTAALFTLLDTCKKHNVKKFVYVSSSMVYGDYSEGVNEEAHCNPKGYYSILKHAGEAITREFCNDNGIAYSITRPSAVYGPRDVNSRVVAKFFDRAMSNGVLVVNGPQERMDFTYVTDAADGIIKATLNPKADGNIYNISRGESRTILEVAEKIIRLAGGGQIEIRPADPFFPTRGALDVSKAKKELHFEPLVDIDDGLKRYYGWLAQ